MNAALSGMARLYLAALFGAAVAASPAVALAQSPPSQERPPLGSIITVDALGELPASANVFALLDTAVPDVVADRIDTGGSSAGDPARVGAHGSSWTQTIFRLGDVDVTDPSGSGTPLLSPGVAEWEQVDVATGIMPVDAPAPGLAVLFTARRPYDAWRGNLDVFGSPPFLNAGGPLSNPPSIARLDSWAHGNLTGGGPVIPGELGGFLSGTWTRSSHFERTSTTALDANLASGFVHLLGTPTSTDTVQATGWLQRARNPVSSHDIFGQPSAGDRNVSVHGQGAWQHQLASASTGVRAFGGFTFRDRQTDLQRTPLVFVERLRDGPVPSRLDAGTGTDRVWHVGGRLNSSVATDTAGHHTVVAGADLEGMTTTMQSAFSGRVGEYVNGLPARIWDFTNPATASEWRELTLDGYVADTIALAPRLTINGGIRFELLRAYQTANAAGPAASWQDFYPRAGVHVALTDFWQIAAFAQYGRYAHRLPLTDLAWGDPDAPTANIYKWTGGTILPGALPGPIVQRLGPGTGGSATFSRIDPTLRRPYMDEMIFGFESRPHPSAFARMVAIARREQPLIGVVDVGVPESTYTTIGVPDPGVDLVGSADDQTVVFYNRSPATFGRDQYLLTNPSDDVATFVGVDVTGQVRAKRLFVIAGATAGRSEGLSANRGFGPLENDAALLGDVYIDPNSRAHAQGRLFTERGYTIKTALAYQFDHDFTASLIGRYQDGQHFARMVVLQDLNQGTEAVRAFRNGRTRFTFTMTVDARLQKAFTLGDRKITAVIDGYNIFNQALEVEEFQVTGAGARLASAVQPPRVIHVGVRIPF